MNNLTTIDASLISQEESMQLIKDRLKDINTELFNTSKEKYLLKVKLIDECQDMSTSEKLDALDCNYDRHTQEVRQNIIITSILGFTLIGIIKVAPAILKKVS